MAIFPVRQLNAQGILRDPSPYALDLTGWSAGANVRFHQNYAERAPVFKTFVSGLATPAPAFAAGVHTSLGADWILVVSARGRLWQYIGAAPTDVTPTSGWSGIQAAAAFTFTQLGDVVYVNRPVQQPYYFAPASTVFATLPGWGATWTARSLRAYGDYLLALNVTKGVTSYPNMVKGSDLALFAQPPGSWDQTDPTTSATENVLEGLTTGIVDGGPLRDGFVIYTEDQIWLAEQGDPTLIFTFRRLFGEGGEMAPNCHVEVDGVHFVFGPSDIYQHDGTSKSSIIDGRNRNYVFRNLIRAQKEACFAAYLPQLDQVWFCYPTSASDAAFTAGSYCNQAAVFDRNSNTWSFVDLPDVSAVSLAYNIAVQTWATETSTWAASTTTWGALDGDNLGSIVAPSTTNIDGTSRLLAYDFANKGALGYPKTASMNAPATLIRTGIDLDQIAANIITYKLVKRLFPLVNTYGSTPITVTVGEQMTPTSTVTWGTPVTFDPTTAYHVDTIVGGRFLALKITQTALADFELYGYDVDLQPNGRR